MKIELSKEEIELIKDWMLQELDSCSYGGGKDEINFSGRFSPHMRDKETMKSLCGKIEEEEE